MTAWLPSYFSDSLGLDLTAASQAALFSPIAAIVASAIASPVADHVVSQGAPVGRVRKTAQVPPSPSLPQGPVQSIRNTQEKKKHACNSRLQDNPASL
jgi:hypothetical protein